MRCFREDRLVRFSEKTHRERERWDKVSEWSEDDGQTEEQGFDERAGIQRLYVSSYLRCV